MTLFGGLYLYEVVLLICGAFLFIGLLVILLVRISRGVPPKQLLPMLPFLILALIMMGFPGIQSIEFTKDKIAITRATDRLREDPEDEEARSELEESVARVERRIHPRRTDSGTLEVLAEANAVLGREEQALSLARTAARLDPQSVKADSLLGRLAADQLDRLVSTHARLADPTKTNEISSLVRDLESRATLTSSARVALSRGQLAIGQTNAARSNIVHTIRAHPELRLEPRLRELARPGP